MMEYILDSSPKKYKLPPSIERIWNEEDVPDIYRTEGFVVIDLQFLDHRVMIVWRGELIYIFHKNEPKLLKWFRNVQKKHRKFLEDPRDFIYHAISTELDIISDEVSRLHKEISKLERNILEALSREHQDIVVRLYQYMSYLLEIKRQLNYFSLSLPKLRGILTPDEIRELRLSIKESLSLINLTLNTAKSLLDVHDKVLSMELNLLIKRLTAISIILAVLTIITGIYGMNFRFIPLADHPLGFWIINGGMILLFFLMLWWFRRIGWM